MGDTVLEIQNVTQQVQSSDVQIKANPNFGRQLRKKIVEQKQEKLPNGLIRITIDLDPSITEETGNE